MSRATRGLAAPAAEWLLLVSVLVFRTGPNRLVAQTAPVQPPEVKMVQLKGQVLGPDGKPVPGAGVGVVGSGRADIELDVDILLAGTCSSETGGFEVPAINLARWFGPWANYCVLARNADGTLMGATVVPGDAVDEPVRVQLQPPGYIHTSVLNPNGQPLAGIETQIRPKDVPGWIEGPRTSDLGDVRIGPLPAGLRLTVSPPQQVRHLVPDDAWSGREITLQPEETFELAPLTLDPGGRSIEGTLEDADGKPLPGAKVACVLPGALASSATADERGRFRLTQLPVSGFDVWLIAADAARQLHVMSLVDPDAGDSTRLVLRPLTSASGVLSGPDGQVLPGVRVRVSPMLKLRYAGSTMYTGWGSEWAPFLEAVETAADGSWQVSGLVAGGMYTLRPEVPKARLDFEKSLFEADREGKPTDFGLMVVE